MNCLEAMADLQGGRGMVHKRTKGSCPTSSQAVLRAASPSHRRSGRQGLPTSQSWHRMCSQHQSKCCHQVSSQVYLPRSSQRQCYRRPYPDNQEAATTTTGHQRHQSVGVCLQSHSTRCQDGASHSCLCITAGEDLVTVMVKQLPISTASQRTPPLIPPLRSSRRQARKKTPSPRLRSSMLPAVTSVAAWPAVYCRRVLSENLTAVFSHHGRPGPPLAAVSSEAIIRPRRSKTARRPKTPVALVPTVACTSSTHSVHLLVEEIDENIEPDFNARGCRTGSADQSTGEDM
ncbi:hypothetical protein GGR56DRAFT_174062 [Xylariaceae sp. FL0804]|nr:hypothetical protein GGR56DRAFT_174062 [Xylariaceae sp. FL0804]